MPFLFNLSDTFTSTSDINFLATTFTAFPSFLLSTLVAYVYVWTLQKSTYSRNYLQSIVLISTITCVIILSVGDSIARGVGIMAAVGIIRFRTNFKNPPDTIFLFALLAVLMPLLLPLKARFVLLWHQCFYVMLLSAPLPIMTV